MPDSQRVALVTGGARRVGRAIVERLADAGFSVLFTWPQSEDEALALVERLTSQGKTIRALRADLLELPGAIDAIDRGVHEHFGRLDLLVNNASAYTPGDLAGTSTNLMRRMMALHFEAPLLLCQRFAADLRAARGHVVNMIDLQGEKPRPQYMAYCASKAALANLTISAARELAPEVTVNGIAPGVVEWPDDFPESGRQNYLKRIPLRRAGTPADAAELVLFLATTGSYITGQIIRLDGGRSIV